MPITSFPIIKAYNPEILLDVISSFLTQDSSSASGTLTVETITGISTGDYLLIGEFGQETAEIVRVHTSTSPSGNTITLNANTVEAHVRGEKVYRIDRNQVEFSRSTTLAGSKSTLTTSDIVAKNLYTTYEDTTNTTGFGWYRWKNSGDTTYTNYSESYPYEGYAEQTLKKIFDSVLTDLGLVDDNGQPKWTAKMSRESAYQAVVDCQDLIARRRYRWSYLTNFDVSFGELSTGDDSYALPVKIAKKNGQAQILSLRIGQNLKMDYVDKRKMNDWREDIAQTTLGSAISGTGDTTVTLTDSSDFLDSGNIQVVADDGESIDSIAYTSNNRTTNVLSGVTGIAAAVANSAIVWQGATFGEPKRYTIFEDTVVLDPPPSPDWEQWNLIGDIYEKPTVVNDLADEAQFPATVIKPFVKYKLELLKYDGDEMKAQGSYQRFLERLKELEENENNGQQFKFSPNRKAETTINLKRKNVLDTTTTIGT